MSTLTYNGPNGIVPGIGVFTAGQSVTEDEAARLRDAGYEVNEAVADVAETPRPSLDNAIEGGH